jgi:signal transduction histidine kinase
MSTTATPLSIQSWIDQRADVLRREHEQALWKQTDRLFAMLLILQWFAAVLIAFWLSPRAWRGLEHHVHPHIWAAVFLGGIITLFPVYLAVFHPGQSLTRMVIAAAQLLDSALLIHLSGGRIETHFHIFGSLAFLSFYRDWRVLVPATLVVAADHALRGIFLPVSVFGVVDSSSWRWVEHVGWVVFEDIFLVWACIRGAREMAALAHRQAELEASHQRVEAEVIRQTRRLEAVSQELISTARRAGMAEIATDVLHNVGNVLNSVNVSAAVVGEKVRKSEVSGLARAADLLRSNQNQLDRFITTDQRGRHLPAFLIELADCLGHEQAAILAELANLENGLEHIKHIVGTQQQHAKTNTLRERITPAEICEEAIHMDLGTAAESQIQIVRQFQALPAVPMDKHKVLQILINLLSNAKRAVLTADCPDKRVTISTQLKRSNAGDRLVFEVTDNGIGIKPENLTRIFSYGFTTRADGHGFGLHSAANAAGEMGGSLNAFSEGFGTGSRFTLQIPLSASSDLERIISGRKVQS